MALAGSGLPTDEFHFAGFLPAKSAAREKAIAMLKRASGTLVLYEAPQRLAATLKALAAGLGARQAVVARELTKLFEEWKRGNLLELAEFYATHGVKGEIVILIGPATEAEKESAADTDQLLREALQSQSLRDAVAGVSAATGIRKSEVYARALKLSGKGVP